MDVFAFLNPWYHFGSVRDLMLYQEFIYFLLHKVHHTVRPQKDPAPSKSQTVYFGKELNAFLLQFHKEDGVNCNLCTCTCIFINDYHMYHCYSTSIYNCKSCVENFEHEKFCFLSCLVCAARKLNCNFFVKQKDVEKKNVQQYLYRLLIPETIKSVSSKIVRQRRFQFYLAQPLCLATFGCSMLCPHPLPYLLLLLLSPKFPKSLRIFFHSFIFLRLRMLWSRLCVFSRK